MMCMRMRKQCNRNSSFPKWQIVIETGNNGIVWTAIIDKNTSTWGANDNAISLTDITENHMQLSVMKAEILIDANTTQSKNGKENKKKVFFHTESLFHYSIVSLSTMSP